MNIKSKFWLAGLVAMSMSFSGEDLNDVREHLETLAKQDDYAAAANMRNRNPTIGRRGDIVLDIDTDQYRFSMKDRKNAVLYIKLAAA